MKLWAFIVTVLASLAFCSVIGERLGVDFLIYRQASFGNLSMNAHGYGWLYADWLANFFLPLSWFSFQTSFLLWYSILILSCAFISTKLIEIPYGHYLLLLAVPAYCFSLYSGNIYPVLILASFSPWGILLAAFFKPHLLGLILVVAFRARIGNRFFARVRPQH
jgi:hypothetical protein